MNTSFLFDKVNKPPEEELIKILGASSDYMIALNKFLESEFSEINSNGNSITKNPAGQGKL